MTEDRQRAFGVVRNWCKASQMHTGASERDAADLATIEAALAAPALTDEDWGRIVTLVEGTAKNQLRKEKRAVWVGIAGKIRAARPQAEGGN